MHEPVLVDEILKALGLNAPLQISGDYIDATLGHAGHAMKIAARAKRVLGIELDQETLEIARKQLEENKIGNVILAKGNFRDIDQLAKENKFVNVAGILIDLGVNNSQLTSRIRGFSFANPKANLDMRIDQKNQNIKASDLLNILRYDQLVDLFSETLHREEAISLSKNIIKQRAFKLFEKVIDFVKVCEESLVDTKKINIATRPFLALRIAVNSEMDNLTEVLPKAFALLGAGGRLVVISFHSGEEKRVNKFYERMVGLHCGQIINTQPIVPGYLERTKNPSSRSAKLWILEKNENEKK